MAPSYASFFKGKYEMDFLNTCERKPSIWLRFLDDIFFIRDHSEEELITFFNNTIKFIYNYSKTNATFLDVNLEKKDNFEIETSVHEKVTNAHLARLNDTNELHQITTYMKKTVTNCEVISVPEIIQKISLQTQLPEHQLYRGRIHKNVVEE
jgi:hypothetical protein